MGRSDVVRRTVTRLRNAQNKRFMEESQERFKHREYGVYGRVCFRCKRPFLACGSELAKDMQCAECAKELDEIYEKCKREAVWI